MKLGGKRESARVGYDQRGKVMCIGDERFDGLDLRVESVKVEGRREKVNQGLVASVEDL